MKRALITGGALALACTPALAAPPLAQVTYTREWPTGRAVAVVDMRTGPVRHGETSITATRTGVRVVITTCRQRAACARGITGSEATETSRAADRAQLAEQLVRERAAWRRERAALRYRVRSALAKPDAEIAMRLAGIAYGQSWTQLRSCALSEGYRDAERFQARVPRANTAGSGAYGPWQFMPATFRGTPYAGLDIARVDVQAHAAAWMWQHGRRGEGGLLPGASRLTPRSAALSAALSGTLAGAS